ncbi:hypothetical protein RAN3_2536 [plant metagenome]|uniref:Uncharacterized protein n=1 Tax=plant metagenome TaxID=1297885 RepID=A0A484U287_9ZZZZ
MATVKNETLGVINIGGKVIAPGQTLPDVDTDHPAISRLVKAKRLSITDAGGSKTVKPVAGKGDGQGDGAGAAKGAADKTSDVPTTVKALKEQLTAWSVDFPSTADKAALQEIYDREAAARAGGTDGDKPETQE